MLRYAHIRESSLEKQERQQQNARICERCGYPKWMHNHPLIRKFRAPKHDYKGGKQP